LKFRSAPPPLDRRSTIDTRRDGSAIHYFYDAINRVTEKTYPALTPPNVKYT
jgi:hypothetical protein